MDGEVVGLARYAAAVRRRGWLVLACMVVFGVAAAGYTTSKPAVYKATAQVLIQPYSSASFNEPAFTTEQVATQVQVMLSTSVAAPVVERLGLDETATALLKSVTAAPAGDTSVIAVTVSRSSPVLAAQIANAFGDSYLASRADNQPQLAKNNSPGRIIDRAQPPLQAAGGSALKAGILGGVIGLILGCIAAIVAAARDTSVYDEGALAIATGGLPVLGRIPRSRSGADGGVAVVARPQSRESSAYRFLATTIRVLDKKRNKAARADMLPTVVLVTSAAPGDGRTSVAANLAVAAAAGGQRVLLCDADVTNPALTSLMGLPPEITLDRVLSGIIPLVPDRLARPAPGLLAMGTAMATVEQPLPVGTGRFARMVSGLSGVVELIVVDSAPLLSSAETLDLVSDADMVLLTVREKASKSTDIEIALERIRQIGGTVSGVVVTRSSASGGTQRPSRRRTSSSSADTSSSTPVTAAASTEPTDLSRR